MNKQELDLITKLLEDSIFWQLIVILILVFGLGLIAGCIIYKYLIV